MTISIVELEKLIKKILLKEYSEVQAAMIADVVMFGELSGRTSHGLIRMLKENYGVFVEGNKGNPEYIQKTKVSTLIDGKGNAGMLVGPMAMYEVLRLAKEHDFGIVGTKGSINTTGSLTYYAEKIAKENYIGIIFTHCSPMMAPFTSKKALFGTNPIAFGIPGDPRPLIFDMSTSAMTFGALAEYKAAGRSLPNNVALDNQGHMTNNPAEAMDGALLSFDNSYKGSSLAMIVEILGALWTGASFAGKHVEAGWGNVYMAFSPELLSDTATVKHRLQELLQAVKTVETRDGNPIRIPGEKTITERDANLKKNEIEISDEIFQKLQSLAK